VPAAIDPEALVGHRVNKLSVEAYLGKEGGEHWYRCVCTRCESVHRRSRSVLLTAAMPTCCGQHTMRQRRRTVHSLLMAQRKFWTIDGRTQSMRSCLTEYGRSYGLVWRRLKAGWSLKVALETPPLPASKRRWGRRTTDETAHVSRH